MRYAVYKPLHTGLQDTKFDLYFRDYVLSRVVCITICWLLVSSSVSTPSVIHSACAVVLV